MQAAVSERYNGNGELKKVTSDDTAHAIGLLSNGATASIFTSLVSVQNELTIEITGSNASIKLDLDDNVFISSLNEPYRKVNVELSKIDKVIIDKISNSRLHVRSIFARSFMHFAHAIIQALSAGKVTVENAATFNDGIHIQEALDMGYRTSKS
jgi:predicted dehydrogenase